MEIRKLIRQVLTETRGQSVELRAAAVRERIDDEHVEAVLMAGLRELVRQELSAARNVTFRAPVSTVEESAPRTKAAPTRTGSWKTRGIREVGMEWKRALEAEYTVEGGGRKPLAECTRDDLLFNIATREKAAAATLVQAERIRQLHALLVEHGVDVVADLPEDVQRDFFTIERAA